MNTALQTLDLSGTWIEIVTIWSGVKSRGIGGSGGKGDGVGRKGGGRGSGQRNRGAGTACGTAYCVPTFPLRDPFYSHTYISRLCDYAGNAIQDSGVTALAEALKANTTLQTLNLSGTLHCGMFGWGRSNHNPEQGES